MKRILISGSIAYDYVMRYDGKFTDIIKPESLHNLSAVFLLKEKTVHFGGCVGNIAYNFSLLKERPIVMGIFGRDFLEYEKWMKKNKVDTGNIIKIKDKDSACAFITSDRDGRQITSFYPGALGSSPEVNLKAFKDEIVFALISPEDDKRMLNIVKECKKFKIPYFFDPGQQLPVFNGEELKWAIDGAKGVFLNEFEFEMLREKLGFVVVGTRRGVFPQKVFLQKEVSPQKENNDIKLLLKMAEMLIITKGEKGSVIYTKNEVIDIPIVQPKKIVDPTGCGDAYRAGFLKGLKDGLSLKKCGEWGAEMGAKAIEFAGTQMHK